MVILLVSLDRMLCAWTRSETGEFEAVRRFLSQRLTQVITSENATKTGLKKHKKSKPKYDINAVYGDSDQQASDRQKLFNQTLKEESALWHNNMPLPYQKKLKREV